MNNIVTSIELSHSGIKMVTGFVLNDQVCVLNKLVSDEIPLDLNGNLDGKILLSTLNNLLKQASSKLNDLGVFVVLLPPDDFKIDSKSVTTYITNDTISQKDYFNCQSMIIKILQPGMSNVYVDPITFTSQECGETKDFPLDKRSDSLGVTADTHMMSKVTYEYYYDIIKKAGINPYLTLIAPFGSASFLLKQKANESFFLLEIENKHSSFSFIQKRHFTFSKVMNYGLSDVIENSSNVLNVSYDRMKDLLLKFGLEENATFKYFTDEKFSLSDISNAIKNGFDIFSDINSLIKQCEDDIDVPIILLGDCKNINGAGSYLGSLLQKKIVRFSNRTIGAREETFIPCLGGISITSNTYMNPSIDKKRHNQDKGLNNAIFSRE